MDLICILINNAFVKFLNIDTNNLTSGYDIKNQFEISCIENNIDYNYVINNYIFIKDKDKDKDKFTDQELNLLYNTCDV